MRPDEVRLQHMLDAAQKTVKYTQDRSRADLETHELWAIISRDLPPLIAELQRLLLKGPRCLSARLGQPPAHVEHGELKLEKHDGVDRGSLNLCIACSHKLADKGKVENDNRVAC